jgi:hypothetical protein
MLKIDDRFLWAIIYVSFSTVVDPYPSLLEIESDIYTLFSSISYSQHFLHQKYNCPKEKLFMRQAAEGGGRSGQGGFARQGPLDLP